MSFFDSLFSEITAHPADHSNASERYGRWKAAARAEVEGNFGGAEAVPRPFGPFGAITLPYTGMGAIDSRDLFGLDELIIFAFYSANRRRYGRALDIGANLGLHSIVMARCGFSVRAFEPDPTHFSILQSNLRSNGASAVEPIRAAVSKTDGAAQFVRVLGNTTGSHLAGAKDSYGERERFEVDTRAAAPLFERADLAKIDAEGHEKEILLAATKADMDHLDIMVEVGSEANARAIFDHFSAIGVNLFPQQLGWRKAGRATELPTSHRNGSLFITAKTEMPWSPS